MSRFFYDSLIMVRLGIFVDRDKGVRYARIRKKIKWIFPKRIETGGRE